MQRWDYHWAKANTAEELYERIASEGENGWELVSVTATLWPESSRAGFQAPGRLQPSIFQAWFKRPRP